MQRLHGIGWKNAVTTALAIVLLPSLTCWYTNAKWRRGTVFRQDVLREYSPVHWSIRNRKIPGQTALDRSLKRDFFQEVLPHWLRMEDKVSMSVSVEACVPFLDHRLVEFCFTLDNSLKIRNSITKYVLRKAMENKLPASIVSESRKFPFSGPDVYWLTGSLKPLLQSSLAQGTPMVFEFIEPTALNSMISSFLNGDHRKEKAKMIWTILNTEMWMRTFFK